MAGLITNPYDPLKSFTNLTQVGNAAAKANLEEVFKAQETSSRVMSILPGGERDCVVGRGRYRN
jgi:hypothetical protein